MFGRRSPYLYPTCQRYRAVYESVSPGAFKSIREARTYLDTLSSATFGLRGEVLKFAEQSLASAKNTFSDWAKYYCIVSATARKIAVPSHSDFEAKREKILRALNAFPSALAILETNQQSDTLALLLLRVQVFYPFLVLATFRDTRECLCDRFQDVFVRTVEVASQYVESNPEEGSQFAFGLEPGIIASLYLIGLKCRHPSTRRKTIELLKKCTVQEGLWAGKLFASYVERLMEIEEQRAFEVLGLDVHLGQVGIPEEARFSDVLFAMDPGIPGSRRLVCTRCTDEKDGALEIVEDRFQG